MKLLNIFLLSGFIFSSVGFAQDDDVYKKFIKYSSITVHQAQKHMLATKINDVGGLLAKSVILQNNAIALYKANNNSRAVCSSNLARKYALEIIHKLNTKAKEMRTISDDEKALLNHCADDAELIKESKNFVNNLSEFDKDYVKTPNNLTIDIK